MKAVGNMGRWRQIIKAVGNMGRWRQIMKAVGNMGRWRQILEQISRAKLLFTCLKAAKVLREIFS